jgi:hypothetical protein
MVDDYNCHHDHHGAPQQIVVVTSHTPLLNPQPVIYQPQPQVYVQQPIQPQYYPQQQPQVYAQPPVQPTVYASAPPSYM